MKNGSKIAVHKGGGGGETNPLSAWPYRPVSCPSQRAVHKYCTVGQGKYSHGGECPEQQGTALGDFLLQSSPRGVDKGDLRAAALPSR